MLLFGHSVVSDSLRPLWTAACQASLSFTISQSLLKIMSIALLIPSNHLVLCHPFLLLPSIFPSIRVFSTSQLFASGGQSIGASASAPVLPMNIQEGFHLGWTGLISFQSKRLSRVFSTLFKSINSLALNFLHGSTLTSVPDYWKNHGSQLPQTRHNDVIFLFFPHDSA